jgi:Cu(I)/Ag(I) efflux system membrane fusion protein
MFVNGILQSHIAENSEELLIPKTSILWTGKRAVVYVRVPNRESPSFIYREIVLGPETGSFYVVANGLKVGEEIASNGVFKIDASAQLLGKSSMMNPEGGKISTGHNHGTSTTLSTHEDMTDEEMDNMEEPKKDGGAMKCGSGKCGDSMGAEKTEKPEKAKKQNPNDVSNQFKKQLGNLVQAYFKMKDAFVATNEKAATAEAKKVLAALEKVDMKLIKGEAHLAWMELQKPIKDNVNAIIQMKGIEMKRSHFSIVSNKITEAVETLGIQTDKTVYLEFCPMAFDDKGAYWISENKEIQNPYFGDVMMRCGEVVRVVSEGDDK